MYKLIVGPPPSVPSLTRQGKPSCHCLEKIKKYSFKPLFNIGRHWINLILGYLDLRYYPCPFILFRLYIQFTSWWVRFRFILSFKTSILLNTLNMFGAHRVGESLKNLRKFLVRIPIGMVIPPSMKAIIGMTTSPVFLSLNHSPWAAYLTPTFGGMLHLVLKFFIPSSESTRCLNLPIF